MGAVVANMSMSLDGFVEAANGGVDLGLLDAIAVDLVPVLLGGGKSFFAGLGAAPIRLRTPTVVEGSGVTHLQFRVEPAA